MSSEPFRLQLNFWGVRGSTPTPIAENLGFGGNTTCLEISGANGDRIIIDGGTGIRALGQKMVAEDGLPDVDLFFTHFHWDHIQGIPFFVPLFQPGRNIRFHSFPPQDEIRNRLERQMACPYFTLEFNDASATRDYFRVEQTFQRGQISVSAFPLNHPQGASGYRIESNGAVIVVATDFEHGNPRLDKVLRENAEGADVLIFDAQYTPAEYSIRRGWGHSHYREGASVAKDACVKKLALFHHDPLHNDADMAQIVREAASLFENTIAAQEQRTIVI